jgi:hypothetical protein
MAISPTRIAGRGNLRYRDATSTSIRRRSARRHGALASSIKAPPIIKPMLGLGLWHCEVTEPTAMESGGGDAAGHLSHRLCPFAVS